VIDLKKNQDVFETSDFTMSVSGALKNIHLNSPAMNVTVTGNFDVKAGDIVPGFQNTGIWYDYFSGDSITVSDVSATVSMEPGEYHIYTSVRLPKPLFTAIGDPGSGMAGRTNVFVFPNPAFGFVQIIAEKTVLKTEIYGMTGKLLGTVKNDNRIDLSNVPAGIYYLRIYLSDHLPRSVKVIRVQQ
jgi:hypothetical protein